MHPILFSSEGLTITSYSALLNLGLALGAALTLVYARRCALPRLHTIDIMLAAIVCAVIGARLGYVVINVAYYSDHLNEAWQFWRGGLSWHAGLLGGVIGVWLIARFRTEQTAARWLDVLTPGLAVGIIFGWMGCFLAACAFGREVFPGEPLFALAIDMPDIYGKWAPRLPSQLLGAAWALIVSAVAWRRASTASATAPFGTHFATFLIHYSAGSLLIGFSRADVAQSFGILNIEQVLDAAVLVITTGGLSIMRRLS